MDFGRDFFALSKKKGVLFINNFYYQIILYFNKNSDDKLLNECF